jgi:hypothetical protein
MNYIAWVNIFKRRTAEQLLAIIDALNTLEKDDDIPREYEFTGLFDGFSIRNAAKEALAWLIARKVQTMVIERLAEEYPQLDASKISHPLTQERIARYIHAIQPEGIKESAGEAIDRVIEDTHQVYPDLKTKFLSEAMQEPGDCPDESEVSILYGDSYYSLEEAAANLIRQTFFKETICTVCHLSAEDVVQPENFKIEGGKCLSCRMQEAGVVIDGRDDLQRHLDELAG